MSRRQAAVLAVDGGNSKADLALVARSGELLALVTGPTISHQQVPLAVAMGRLRDLAGDGARRARARLPAELGSFGVAGADFPKDVAALRRGIEGIGVARRVIVRNDTFAALRAGTLRGWGIVVICGAGANAAGIGPDGRTARLAALGDISGDWGGGYGVGQAALAAAVRARDGRGPRTSLERSVPARLGFARPADVTKALYEDRLESRRLEELSPLVFSEATAGDTVARSIVDRLADELAVMAVAIARRLRVARAEVDVVLAGGVFRATDPEFYTRLEQRVAVAVPRARIARLEERPVLGAALLGLDELGARPGGATERRLRQEFASLR
ncbi:MAG TPA: BadF/BadG/BcrA/BcrD ATPase family protein [Candidatus Limnocylindria bacterium]|nr:BadF/BadG/BcrA/BcrD ATPase family protein [Candidatus Limnocylindria bacterium]